MHFYKFHIGDYMSHTRHLSLYEDLAYRRLLDFYFLHEQPIKHRDAARHIGMRDHEEDVLTVLNEFFLSTENGFINVRADKEIAEFRKHQAVSAYGAFIRDNPSLKHLVNKEDFIFHYLASSIDVYIGTLRGNDVPIVDTSSGDDAPLTINHKPITNNQVNKEYIDRFDTFWKHYPRKVAKPNALKAWLKLKPDDDLTKKIISAVSKQNLSAREEKFVPHPASWLNAQRWEDETMVTSTPNLFNGRIVK